MSETAMLYPIQGARSARIVSDVLERSGAPAHRGRGLFNRARAFDAALVAMVVALGMLVIAG
jgi:hypothetical protein